MAGNVRLKQGHNFFHHIPSFHPIERSPVKFLRFKLNFFSLADGTNFEAGNPPKSFH